jgi:hypothetical protein
MYSLICFSFMGLVGLLGGSRGRQKIDQEQYFLDYRQGEATTLSVTIVAQQLLEIGGTPRCPRVRRFLIADVRQICPACFAFSGPSIERQPDRVPCGARRPPANHFDVEVAVQLQAMASNSSRMPLSW